ncbi:MAG: ABC transporter substrate-binding protein, partial [Methylocella sp.]
MFKNFPLAGRVATGSLALALLAVVGSSARAGDSAKTIEVAINLPFSGTSGGTVSSMANAYSLAVDEANAAGLPGGYHVRIMRFDHGRPGATFDLKLAAKNARDNVADSKIVAVFGTLNSAAAKAEIPILDAAGLAEISSTNTNPGLTKGAPAAKLRQARPDDNPFFRVCGTDDMQGPAGAQLLNQIGAKSVYIVDDNDAYGKTLADLFEI